MIGRILWEGCANGRSACSAGSLCKCASWKGCKPSTCGFWAKKKMPSSHPRERHSWFPTRVTQRSTGPGTAMARPGAAREEDEERRGCTNRLTPRPGRAAQQPVPKLQNKSFPRTQPRGRSANWTSLRQSRRSPGANRGSRGRARTEPAGILLWGKGLGSGGCSFHLGRLSWDEPSAGSERGGGNVASLCGGRSSPASLRILGRSLKACSVSRESRDPSETLDWASFF